MGEGDRPGRRLQQGLEQFRRALCQGFILRFQQLRLNPPQSRRAPREIADAGEELPGFIQPQRKGCIRHSHHGVKGNGLLCGARADAGAYRALRMRLPARQQRQVCCRRRDHRSKISGTSIGPPNARYCSGDGIGERRAIHRALPARAPPGDEKLSAASPLGVKPVRNTLRRSTGPAASVSRSRAPRTAVCSSARSKSSGPNCSPRQWRKSG